MNVLLLTSHSIAEHDDLDMFTRMGVDTFSIGAYTDPSDPSDDKRPPLPHAPYFPRLDEACRVQRERHANDDARFVIDWAKGDLAEAVVDWADTIIVHHFPEAWIGGNWARIRDKRVIWRTCGQSDPRLEAEMSRYQGLQVVRYSEREREAFGGDLFGGEDACIPFGKDPLEWSGWRGDEPVVGNITQHMAQRGDACGYPFWASATAGLPTQPAGPGSEVLPGGLGALSYDAMREYLRSVRVYLYTGTRPASYTLGAIEAAMTGVPVVSIGAQAWGLPSLADFCLFSAEYGDHTNDPTEVRRILRRYLEAPDVDASIAQRARVVETFGLDRVMVLWRSFLGIAS